MLANDFDYVVIDGEAGIEQISRRVMEQVSHLVLVTDQSAKGVNVCREIKEAADDLITYERIGMIVNRVVDPSMNDLVRLDRGAGARLHPHRSAARRQRHPRQERV